MTIFIFYFLFSPNFKLIVKIPAASGQQFFFAEPFSYTPISKNVVGENDECQLSNGHCTTKKRNVGIEY